MVASNLICWPILENILSERFLRQQSVKVYRRLEDPTVPKTWTLLKTLCHTCLSEEAKQEVIETWDDTRSLCELPFADCYVFSGHRTRATYSGMSEIQNLFAAHCLIDAWTALVCVAMLRLSLLTRETEVSLLRCKMQQRVVTQQRVTCSAVFRGAW